MFHTVASEGYNHGKFFQTTLRERNRDVYAYTHVHSRAHISPLIEITHEATEALSYTQRKANTDKPIDTHTHTPNHDKYSQTHTHAHTHTNVHTHALKHAQIPQGSISLALTLSHAQNP